MPSTSVVSVHDHKREPRAAAVPRLDHPRLEGEMSARVIEPVLRGLAVLASPWPGQPDVWPM
ncbi:hypothetical protein ACWHLZ_26840 [Streptomyces chartreusis]